MVHRLVIAALLLVACNSSPPALSDAGVDSRTDGRIVQCAAGLKPYGPACMPIFDECKEDEVPLLGGGCKKVGVEECEIEGQPGIKAPPDWACKRIGVQECEIDGTPGIKGPPSWTCQRVGVEECVAAGGGPGLKGPPSWTCTPVGPPTTCLAGWAKTTDGWCEPIVPAKPSGPGTMEVIGQKSCQSIGDCGSGPWGKIVVGPNTIFVDRGYSGGIGIAASSSQVTVADSVVASNAGAGLGVFSSNTSLARSVVRDSRPTPDGTYGIGIEVVSEVDGPPSTMSVQDTLVAGNGFIGHGPALHRQRHSNGAGRRRARRRRQTARKP